MGNSVLATADKCDHRRSATMLQIGIKHQITYRVFYEHQSWPVTAKDVYLDSLL